jgi:hypothetical protein
MASYSGSSSTPNPRAKLVKPILRKFTQSEKNSLDLSRPAAEQGLGIYASEYGTGSRSVHDVSFQSTGRRGYHTRTTSGASQFSTATSGSGHRNGSFVHPFQQTPRPYTPPLAQSYQASMLSEYSHDGDVLAEDEVQATRPQNVRTTSNLSSQSGSFSVTTTPTLPSLRVQTKNNSSLRLAPGNSQSNLHSSFITSPDLISPVDTMSPSSALRTSMEKGFRLRSRSDGVAETITIQEARRQFEERERAKEEKAELAEQKAQERRNAREARLLEKSRTKSNGSEPRTKRSKSDPTPQEKGDGFMARDYDNLPTQAPPKISENFEEFQPSQPRRSRTGTTASNTKKRTHSAWTTFMIWLRTRFLRMGKPRRRD